MKWWFLFLFLLLVFSLGCIKKESETKNVSEKQEVKNITEEKEEKVYSCPLNSSKFNLNCETDEDCKLVKCENPVGIIEQCVNINSEYQGEKNNKCICKTIGTIKEFSNGKEIERVVKECRHI